MYRSSDLYINVYREKPINVSINYIHVLMFQLVIFTINNEKQTIVL